MHDFEKIIFICNAFKDGKYDVEEFQSRLQTAHLPETESGVKAHVIVLDAIEQLEAVRFLFGEGRNDQGIEVADELIRTFNNSYKWL